MYFGGIHRWRKKTTFFSRGERGEVARDLASGVEVTEHVILTYFINNSVQGKVSSTCIIHYCDGSGTGRRASNDSLS
jgi:hypothetical protein